MSKIKLFLQEIINVMCTLLFAAFMLLQLITLRMANGAGSGYLPDVWQGRVYLFIQIIVITGIICHVLLYRLISKKIDSDGILWLLNSDGVSAWGRERDNDPTLSARVKGIEPSFNPEEGKNDYVSGFYGVFKGCVNLENLVFEKRVTSLSWYEFEDCTNLKTITFKDKVPTNLSYCLMKAPKDVLVTVPEGMEGYLSTYPYLSSTEKRYGLSVNGVLMTKSTLSAECGEGTATFDPETNTLTLENAELTKSFTPHWLPTSSDDGATVYQSAAIVSDLPKLNVVLKGKNVVAKGSIDAFRAYGDLNISGDGSITANDALLILRASVSLEELTPDQRTKSDVDGDNDISANDALAVLRSSVGMSDDNLVGKLMA